MTIANDIEAEAMEWLVRLDALENTGGPSGNGSGGAGGGLERLRADFNAWCDSDARRHAAYIRLSAAWRKADQLKRLFPLDGLVDENLLAPKAASHSEPTAQRPRNKANRHVGNTRLRGWRMALAASVAIAAVGAVAWLTADRLTGKTYSTDVGGFQRLLLADGSTVELNTDSEVRVRFTGEFRHIALLRGQANFKVARDTQRPFEVEVAGATVRALGTAFSVRLRERQQVEVMVTEGRVALADQDAVRDITQRGGNAVVPESVSTLSAGQAAVIKLAQLSVQQVRIESSEIARQMSWTEGRLALDGETLREAVMEFNRYNLRQLVIADPAIENIRVGGSFQPTDLKSFVTALERSFGVRVQSEDSTEIRLVRE